MQKVGSVLFAESGLPTFRDANGLWEGHEVMEVASPEGWNKNKELVLDFYNQRRKQALAAKPNDGHKSLADLEKDFEVTIITQNVDNLHEKAGSSHVLHLHGELFKSRSTVDDSLVYDMIGDKCEKGSQLRPHIVWFGEMVPTIEVAVEYVLQADVFMVVGTSMVVYPAAGLINYVKEEIPKFIIDPNIPDIQQQKNMYLYEEKGGTGVPLVAELLREKYR